MKTMTKDLEYAIDLVSLIYAMRNNTGFDYAKKNISIGVLNLITDKFFGENTLIYDSNTIILDKEKILKSIKKDAKNTVKKDFLETVLKIKNLENYKGKYITAKFIKTNENKEKYIYLDKNYGEVFSRSLKQFLENGETQTVDSVKSAIIDILSEIDLFKAALGENYDILFFGGVKSVSLINDIINNISFKEIISLNNLNDDILNDLIQKRDYDTLIEHVKNKIKYIITKKNNEITISGNLSAIKIRKSKNFIYNSIVFKYKHKMFIPK